MSAFGGKADIEAKVLTRDEARRIGGEYREAAGTITVDARQAKAAARWELSLSATRYEHREAQGAG
jgi:hypothetical protein